MKSLIFCFIYIAILVFHAEILSLYFGVGFRLYLIDIPIILALPIVISLMFLNRNKYKEEVFWFFLLQALIFILIIYSMFFMSNPIDRVLGQARVFGLYSFIYLVFFFSLNSIDCVRILKKGQLGASSLLLLIGMFRLITGEGYMHEAYSENMNDTTRYFSYFETVVLSLSFFNVLYKILSSSFNHNYKDIILCVFILIAIGMSNFRSVWVATIVAISFLVLGTTRFNIYLIVRRYLIGLITVSVMAVSFFYTNRVSVITKFNSESVSNGLLGRIEMWSIALQNIYEKPLLGSGVGFFLDLHAHIGTVHSDVLQVIQNFGIIGASLFVFIIIRIYGIGAKSKAQTSICSPYRLALTYTIFSSILIALLEPIILQPQFVLIFFSTLALVHKSESEDIFCSPLFKLESRRVIKSCDY